MNDARGRKRLIWAGTLAATLVVSFLFISLFSPAGPKQTSIPEVRVSDSSLAQPLSTPATLALDAEAENAGGFSLGGGQIISLAWRLGLVALIIGVSIVGLRWWGKKAAGPRSVTGFLRVIDTLSISNGRTMHLVALGDRVIAIGATAQQLTMLNELTEDEARQVLADAPTSGDQPVIAFASELFQSMRRGHRQAPGDGPAVITRESR
mgnify:CR=1 FL=1